MRWVGLFLTGAIACLPLAAAQATRISVTPAGDTVTSAVYVSPGQPVVDSVLPPVRRTAVKPDTVKVSEYLPAPSPAVASTDTQYIVSPNQLGKPYGAFNVYSGWSTINDGPWTLTTQPSSPSGILLQLAAARARHMHLVLGMTGGSHAKYITNAKFDLEKWKAAQGAYNTAAIKAAVDLAIQDGTVIGASLMDEPNHPSWGGVPTPALLDTMSRYVKAIFPNLKTAVVVQWTWYSTTPYASLDFMIAQYAARLGPVDAYRDSATASAKRRGVGLMFSMNVLNGGARLSPCPAGSYSTNNCMMTATEIVQNGKTLLGSGACGLLMWQYNATFMARPENVGAFADLAAYAERQPAAPCQRP